MVAEGKMVPADMVVRMLRRVIYTGHGNKKFLLCSFPESVEQVDEFEQNCARLSAIIYATPDEYTTVELRKDNLNVFQIDSYFQKQFRLKTFTEWSDKQFE